jgi:hypothetical protein
MEHLKSVITMLKNYVKVGEVKKKEAGEVMTPLDLVKEMLATLPEDVWSNPNLKWLDSCNGSGPFLVMVIYKLMIGLKDWESDEEKRYKHIVENMIYAGELQPKNMFLFVSAIDPFNEYNLNIYTGSFLDKEFDIHMKTVWGLEKFNIVVGNPPYNENNSNNDDKLYFKFIKKSFSILYEMGLLCFVLPDDSVSYIVKTEKMHIKLLNTNNIVNRYFKGIGTKIVYFLSVKDINIKKTVFIDSEYSNELMLNDMDVILMNIKDTEIINKISKFSKNRFKYKFAKYKGNNYRIRFNSIKLESFSLRGINLFCVDDKLLKKHNLVKNNNIPMIFKYKVVDHSVDRIEFLSDSNFDNDKKRVLINAIGDIKSIYDEDGDYLLTDGIIYIDVNNKLEADNLISILNSPLCIYLQKVITHNTKNKYKILNYLPIIELNGNITDSQLYSLFELSNDEITHINKSVLSINI